MKKLLRFALLGLLLVHVSACSIGTPSKTRVSVSPSLAEQDPMFWEMMGDR